MPPDAWMVVDGCSAATTDYAAAVLSHYHARPRIVILTHPHDDHSGGLVSVIEAATPHDRKETWPRIGMLVPPESDVGRSAGFIGCVTAEAIAAIESRWSESPACRWDMNIGDLEPLGGAMLRVLSPRADVRAEALRRWQMGQRFNANVISTALLLTWRGRRLLLGSDLVERPASGWSHALVVDPQLGDDDLLKVPHHGSDEALLDDILRPGARVPDPLRLFTPYSPKRLPSFAAGKGAHRVVSHGGTSYLTGLPRRHAMQSGRAEARTLTALRAHDTITFDATTTGFPDCYVLVSVPPDGGPPTVEQGPGSLRVVPDASGAAPRTAWDHLVSDEL
ncbi:hypothetical protein WME98_43555 [Sorangium sp. So ce296]